MVKKGNPKRITGLKDLARTDVCFINRQRGSGTRILLDYELSKLNIACSQIYGYEKEVGTHMAVAASIAAGTADAGLGVKAAGQALELEFIPVPEEQYDLLLNFADDEKYLNVILEILQTNEFRQQIEALGGYDLKKAGECLWQR